MAQITVFSILQKLHGPFIALIIGALPLLSWGQLQDEELLPEDEAFAFQAQWMPDNRIEVRWDIADGYYMYRDKMDFDILGENGFSVAVELPPGKPKHDEFFGDVEVFTSSFRMVLPLKDSIAGFTLIAEGQGCNEPIGVCYPPLRHEISFEPGFSQPNATSDVKSDNHLLAQSDNLGIQMGGSQDNRHADPVSELRNILQSNQNNNTSRNDIRADTNPLSADGVSQSIQENSDSIETLKNLLESGIPQPEFLLPEEAFRFTAEVVDSNTLNARFDVVDGYYLYRDKISFASQGDARVADYVLPDGEEKVDEFFGLSRIFKRSFTIPIDLQRSAPGSGSMVLNAAYQGCAEMGICYPPSTQSVTLALPPVISASEASESPPPNSNNAASFNLQSPSETEQNPDTRSLLSILSGALLAGLLLTFTPCVLPMIPILSGAIAGQAENLTRAQGGALAVTYVIGTSVTYAAMGWIAGATGEQLQAYFQNVWAIGILATVFFLMALSMFGLYEIQMPSVVQSRLQSRTMGFGGSYPMVFILGLVSALIVGACVSPILISFLGIAVSRADPWLGAQMMFVMSLGMGVPLVALGFGAGYLLPKAGAWMDLVKHFFGILLIAVAIYLLGSLPDLPVLLFWGVFFIIISIYLGATQSLPEGASGWRRLAKGVGTVFLVWGIAALVGGFHGERDLLKPLPMKLYSMGSPDDIQSAGESTFLNIHNTTELDQEFSAARKNGRYIVLDYYADWCVDCIKMKKTTFRDPQVLNVLDQRYHALQVDVTDPNNSATRAIKKRFGVFGPPAVLFFDSQGNRLRELSFYGYRGPEEFLALLNH